MKHKAPTFQLVFSSVSSDDRAKKAHTVSSVRAAIVTSTVYSAAAKDARRDFSRARTSEILRSVLTKNPGVRSFSVARIVSSIGSERVEASLAMFAIPTVVPIEKPKGIVAVPMGTIACHFVTGRERLTLPRHILDKCVSRRALTVAIHATLPVIEAAERLMRPRWSWASHPIARRAIGLLVFLLAVAIGCPWFGFNELHGLSVFIVSLGLTEQDGIAITIGVVAGLLSLVALAVSGLSVRALRTKLGKVLRGVGRKLGLTAIANFLRRLGYRRLARFITLEWTDLVMSWDPERSAAKRTCMERPRDAVRPVSPASETTGKVVVMNPKPDIHRCARSVHGGRPRMRGGDTPRVTFA
jgi:hypothetical protein